MSIRQRSVALPWITGGTLKKFSSKADLNSQGFNTLLGNALPSAKGLDQLLKKGVKLLDSCSVFYAPAEDQCHRAVSVRPIPDGELS